MFKPFKLGACFTYKCPLPDQKPHVMRITGIIYWDGDNTAKYLAHWADDPSDSTWTMPMEVAHELLLELYKPCPAFEILYGENNV